MRKQFLKGVLVSIIISAVIFVFAGCEYNGIIPGPFSFDDGSYTSFTDSRECVTEGYFRLTIHTDKDEFAKGEAIGCWAEIEYIGDQPSITVYSWGSPISMDITGKDLSYSSSGGMFFSGSDDSTLVLEKGKPVRVYLSDVIPKSSSMLPGRYEIDAYAGFGLSLDGAVSYNGYVSAVIEVTE